MYICIHFKKVDRQIDLFMFISTSTKIHLHMNILTYMDAGGHSGTWRGVVEGQECWRGTHPSPKKWKTVVSQVLARDSSS